MFSWTVPDVPRCVHREAVVLHKMPGVLHRLSPGRTDYPVPILRGGDIRAAGSGRLPADVDQPQLAGGRADC